MKKLICLLTALILAVPGAEAQFFKKLKKKVQEKVENAVTENVSDKAASEAEKSLNDLWETDFKNSAISFGAERVDPASIPATYDFSWEYQMKMSTSEGEVEMIYLIKENAPYIGIKIPQAQNMVTVLDNANEMTVMYMDSGENKMVMASKINASSAEAEETGNPYENMEMKKIGTKEILGYECQGYQTENDEHIYKFYVTDEAGISFTDLVQTNQKNVPEGFDAEWLQDGEGLLMEMQMEDKKNPARSASMTCTGIEKKPFVIKTANYQGIGG